MFVIHEFWSAVSRAEREPSMSGADNAGTRLAWAAQNVLGASGAGIALWPVDSLSVPWGSSSAHAAVAEQAQATTGQGPCMDSFAVGHPVMASATVIERFWPGFAEVFTGRTPFRSVYAAPISQIGALDMYFTGPEDCRAVRVGDAAAVAGEIAVAAINDPVMTDAQQALGWRRPSWPQRAQVAIATGMLAAALQIELAAALALLRARAFADDMLIDSLAGAVVAGVTSTESFR